MKERKNEVQTQETGAKQGFQHWFINVFWYHYGKLAIAAVIVLGVVIWLTLDVLQKVEYDLNVAIVLESGLARADTDKLGALLGEAAGDVNGDGKVNVNIVTVNLSDPENLEGSQYQMLLYMALPEYTIFILNDYYSSLYGEKDETFQELAPYGIETDDESGRRLWVGDKAILRELGEYEYYACLSDWTVDGKGSAEMTAAAVRALKALAASPDAESAD